MQGRVKEVPGDDAKTAEASSSLACASRSWLALLFSSLASRTRLAAVAILMRVCLSTCRVPSCSPLIAARAGMVRSGADLQARSSLAKLRIWSGADLWPKRSFSLWRGPRTSAGYSRTVLAKLPDFTCRSQASPWIAESIAPRLVKIKLDQLWDHLDGQIVVVLDVHIHATNCSNACSSLCCTKILQQSFKTAIAS